MEGNEEEHDRGGTMDRIWEPEVEGNKWKDD